MGSNSTHNTNNRNSLNTLNNTNTLSRGAAYSMSKLFMSLDNGLFVYEGFWNDLLFTSAK